MLLTGDAPMGAEQDYPIVTLNNCFLEKKYNIWNLILISALKEMKYYIFKRIIDTLFVCFTRTKFAFLPVFLLSCYLLFFLVVFFQGYLLFMCLFVRIFAYVFVFFHSTSSVPYLSFNLFIVAFVRIEHSFQYSSFKHFVQRNFPWTDYVHQHVCTYSSF